MRNQRHLANCKVIYLHKTANAVTASLGMEDDRFPQLALGATC